MTIPVSPTKPTKPGLYLFQGLYTDCAQLVRLYWRTPAFPAMDEPYLAAAGHSTAPERWLGQWSEPIEVFSSLDKRA